MPSSENIADSQNLWPVGEISVDVVTPAAFLRSQASQLRQITKGLVIGEVTITEGEKEIQLSLDLVAPFLENARYRLLTVKHERNLFYPIRTTSSFDEVVSTAYTQTEFTSQFEGLLKRRETVGIIQSLIARSNEEKATTKSAA